MSGLDQTPRKDVDGSRDGCLAVQTVGRENVGCGVARWWYEDEF